MKRILLACLLLAACASDPAPRTQAPSAPASPSPSAAPSPSATADAEGLLVAVVRDSGGLELHRVDRTTRAATLERVLAPPQEGAVALDATLGAMSLCAAWHVGSAPVGEEPDTRVVCYPQGSPQGRVVAGPTLPVHVALSSDGTRLAWAESTSGGNQVVGLGRLADGALSGARRFLANADRPPEAFNGTAVQDLAWADDGEVVISTAVESDDGPNLLRVDVTAAGTRGWLDDGRAVQTRTPGYLTYDSVLSVHGGVALAVERGSFLDEPEVPSRAVRVDLADGAVLEVLATAAEGRAVVGVSGGPEAAVYVTAGNDRVLKPYLRLRGQARGEVITGLPSDARQVLTRG